MEGSWVAQYPTHPGTRSTVAFSSPSVNGPRPAPLPPPHGLGFPPLGGLSSAVTIAVTVILPPARDSSYTLPAFSAALYTIARPLRDNVPLRHVIFIHLRLQTRYNGRQSRPSNPARPKSESARPPDLSAHLSTDNRLSHRRIVARIQSILHFPPDPDTFDS